MTRKTWDAMGGGPARARLRRRSSGDQMHRWAFTACMGSPRALSVNGDHVGSAIGRRLHWQSNSNLRQRSMGRRGSESAEKWSRIEANGSRCDTVNSLELPIKSWFDLNLKAIVLRPIPSI